VYIEKEAMTSWEWIGERWKGRYTQVYTKCSVVYKTQEGCIKSQSQMMQKKYMYLANRRVELETKEADWYARQ
jgi:hypothetical protein